MNCNGTVKGIILLSALVAMAGQASAAVANYDVEVSREGGASVTLLITGGGEYEVPLPHDAKNLRVKNGEYVTSISGIIVSTNESTLVRYNSDFVVLQKGEIRMAQLDLPNTEKSVVMMSLPKGAIVEAVFPTGRLFESNDSVNLVWSIQESKLVSARYLLGNDSEKAIGGADTLEVPQTQPTKVGESELPFVPIVIVAALCGLCLVFYVKLKKGNIVAPAPVMTPGKENVVKTLTDNEALVVNTLMSHKGGMKRNKVAKLTGISKSSLSGALATLEAKKIVTVDKSKNVHYVSISEWFKSL